MISRKNLAFCIFMQHVGLICLVPNKDTNSSYFLLLTSTAFWFILQINLSSPSGNVLPGV